jgi:uncharacterized protein with HEPN domain
VRSDRERLLDVIEAGGRIQQHLGSDRQRLDDNEVLQLAIVRLVEIIGEACRGLSTVVKERHPEVDWAGIAGMRNRLAHGYFDIDLDAVWNAASVEVPQFLEQVRTMLDEIP